MKKVKILRIIARLNIGGPAIHTILLAAYFNNVRYTSILVKGKEGPREGDMLYLAREKGVEPIFIPELQREISPVKDCVALWKLYRLIGRERPDIVHTHTAKAGVLGRIAAWLAGVPIILHTFHGNILKGYFGSIRTWIFIQVERVMAKISTKVIVLSKGLKKELNAMGITPQEKIEVIPLGLELERFVKSNEKGRFKSSLGLSKDCTLVGTVGRLVPIKGHRYFLEAAKEIREATYKEGLSPELKFVIVGDGELKGALEDYAKELDLEDMLIFTGFRPDLPEIYQDFDIVVLSSLNEGTPVSLIEAMASGRPVVATRVGGVVDLVEDGETGLLVKPGSGSELANGISELLKDRERREVMGKKGKEGVYHAYDIKTLVKGIDIVYTSLLKEDYYNREKGSE